MSKATTAVAFAELKLELERYLEEHFPGLGLAELRARGSAGWHPGTVTRELRPWISSRC